MADTTTTVNASPVSISDFWDPLYDSFDVDLIMKVLAHTAFSKCCATCLSTAWLTSCRPLLHLLHSRLLHLPRRSLARLHHRHLCLLQCRRICVL